MTTEEPRFEYGIVKISGNITFILTHVYVLLSYCIENALLFEYFEVRKIAFEYL